MLEDYLEDYLLVPLEQRERCTATTEFGQCTEYCDWQLASEQKAALCYTHMHVMLLSYRQKSRLQDENEGIDISQQSTTKQQTVNLLHDCCLDN